MAKKASTAKKTARAARTTKKSSARSAAKKTTTRKKAAAAKKPSTRAKTSTRRKATSKEKASSGAAKVVKKKTTRKGAGTPKASSSASRKKTTKRRASGSGATPASGKTKRPSGGSGGSAGKKSSARTRAAAGALGQAKPSSASNQKAPPGPTNRRGSTLGAAREAALRLASAAGLAPLSQRTVPADAAWASAKRARRSPLKPEEIEAFRRTLLEKRAEVLGDVTDMENEALGSRSGALSAFPQHLADQGSDEYDQSLALGLAASQRSLLREIDAALERIENGTFGICEMLGTPIAKARLEATPWARLSVEGARRMDQTGGS